MAKDDAKNIQSQREKCACGGQGACCGSSTQKKCPCLKEREKIEKLLQKKFSSKNRKITVCTCGTDVATGTDEPIDGTPRGEAPVSKVAQTDRVAETQTPDSTYPHEQPMHQFCQGPMAQGPVCPPSHGCFSTQRPYSCGVQHRQDWQESELPVSDQSSYPQLYPEEDSRMRNMSREHMAVPITIDPSLFGNECKQIIILRDISCQDCFHGASPAATAFSAHPLASAPSSAYSSPPPPYSPSPPSLPQTPGSPMSESPTSSPPTSPAAPKQPTSLSTTPPSPPTQPQPPFALKLQPITQPSSPPQNSPSSEKRPSPSQDQASPQSTPPPPSAPPPPPPRQHPPLPRQVAPSSQPQTPITHSVCRTDYDSWSSGKSNVEQEGLFSSCSVSGAPCVNTVPLCASRPCCHDPAGLCSASDGKCDPSSFAPAGSQPSAEPTSGEPSIRGTYVLSGGQITFYPPLDLKDEKGDTSKASLTLKSTGSLASYPPSPRQNNWDRPASEQGAPAQTSGAPSSPAPNVAPRSNEQPQPAENMQQPASPRNVNLCYGSATAPHFQPRLCPYPSMCEYGPPGSRPSPEGVAVPRQRPAESPSGGVPPAGSAYKSQPPVGTSNRFQPQEAAPPFVTRQPSQTGGAPSATPTPTSAPATSSPQTWSPVTLTRLQDSASKESQTPPTSPMQTYRSNSRIFDPWMGQRPHSTRPRFSPSGVCGIQDVCKEPQKKK